MLQSTLKNRSIFCSDNLEILENINSNCIDLIYLDPPFNKKKIFTAPIGSEAEGAEFSDIFREEDVKDEWVQTIKEDNEKLHNFLTGVKNIDGRSSYNYCYLCYMAIRLIEMQRILKKTGSIYLHCDPTMSHYLKIVLDCILEEGNFRNEIIWQRNDGRGKGSQFQDKKFGSNTDIIFFYTKSNEYYLNAKLKINLTDENIIKKFNKIDKKNEKYYTGIPIFCSQSMGARPNLCYTWKGFTNPHPSGWRLSKKRLQEEYEKGNVVINDRKLERRKYLKDYEGIPLDNNWIDIPRVVGNEAIGYPTQKPLALLERIIKASSKEGELVLDPFCGCATTCVAAEKLGRKWIGIDVSKKAYELVQMRLKKEISSEIWDDKKINYFATSNLKRTDGGGKELEKKYVYIILKESELPYYKVGIAKDWKARLNSYQTSDKDRDYKMIYKFHTTKFREIEKYIHNKFSNLHEWVQADPNDIIKEIENYEK